MNWLFMILIIKGRHASNSNDNTKLVVNTSLMELMLFNCLPALTKAAEIGIIPTTVDKQKAGNDNLVIPKVAFKAINGMPGTIRIPSAYKKP